MRLVVKSKVKKYLYPQKPRGILTKGESQCGKMAILSADEAKGCSPCWACGCYHAVQQ